MDTVRGAAGVGEPFLVAPHNPLDHRESHSGACYHPNQPHPVIVDAEVVDDYQPRHLDPLTPWVEASPPDGYEGRHRRD